MKGSILSLSCDCTGSGGVMPTITLEGELEATAGRVFAKDVAIPDVRLERHGESGDHERLRGELGDQRQQRGDVPAEGAPEHLDADQKDRASGSDRRLGCNEPTDSYQDHGGRGDGLHEVVAERRGIFRNAL